MRIDQGRYPADEIGPFQLRDGNPPHAGWRQAPSRNSADRPAARGPRPPGIETLTTSRKSAAGSFARAGMRAAGEGSVRPGAGPWCGGCWCRPARPRRANSGHPIRPAQRSVMGERRANGGAGEQVKLETGARRCRGIERRGDPRYLPSAPDCGRNLRQKPSESRLTNTCRSRARRGMAAIGRMPLCRRPPGADAGASRARGPMPVRRRTRFPDRRSGAQHGQRPHRRGVRTGGSAVGGSGKRGLRRLAVDGRAGPASGPMASGGATPSIKLRGAGRTVSHQPRPVSTRHGPAIPRGGRHRRPSQGATHRRSTRGWSACRCGVTWRELPGDRGGTVEGG